jgi:hypothetical protein
MSTASFVHAILGHSVLVHELFESCTLLGVAFCVVYCALLNVEFVHNCKLAALTDLRGLYWNASVMQLTFSLEVSIFAGDFTHNRLPVVLSFVVTEPNAFLYRRLTSILHSKMALDSCTRLKIC